MRKILKQVGARIYKTTPNFWRCYQDLSREIKQLAQKKFALLIRDPTHPSLGLKKIGKQWAVRVNKDYRALAHEEDGNLVWFWIGKHDEYVRILRSSY